MGSVYRGWPRGLLFGVVFGAGCAPEALPVPTEVAIEAQLDRSAQPPLYRHLYDYAFLPEVQDKEQRVRLLIWLRYLELSRYQLGLFQELQTRTEAERRAVEERQQEILLAHEPAIGATYDQLWEAMNQGASEDDLARIGAGLGDARAREAELLDLRARSIRALLDAQQTFLRTLTPAQEAMFADATFLLRHRLDPYANPGDFNALIGSVYVAGQFGALTRPTFDPNEDHLNIGGLWSENPARVAGAYFPNARREVVLYLVLLEPMLPEALAAAVKLRATTPEPPAGAPPGPAPAPGGPAGSPSPPEGGTLSPGVPEPPAPGRPLAPTPGQPTPPEPPPAP